jgi:acyl-CoA thioester hydrolase
MTEQRIPVFERTRTVRERDCDVLGHVNNLRWVRWVVELAEAHAEALGFPFEKCRELGGVWVVREQSLSYPRGALPGEELREATWVSVMQGARSVRHARFTDAGGVLRFESRTLWAFVDVATMRPARISKTMQERFDLVTEPEPRP